MTVILASASVSQRGQWSSNLVHPVFSGSGKTNVLLWRGSENLLILWMATLSWPHWSLLSGSLCIWCLEEHRLLQKTQPHLQPRHVQPVGPWGSDSPSDRAMCMVSRPGQRLGFMLLEQGT